MLAKRQVLEQLTAAELRAIVDGYDLAVEDRRVRDHLIDASASRNVDLGEVLAEYTRDRLKELCRALGLDDGGREKILLVERLAPGAGAAPASAADRENRVGSPQQHRQPYQQSIPFPGEGTQAASPRGKVVDDAMDAIEQANRLVRHSGPFTPPIQQSILPQRRHGNGV